MYRAVPERKRIVLIGGADSNLFTVLLIPHDKQHDLSMAYCIFFHVFLVKFVSGFSTNNPVTCPVYSYYCDNGQCVSEFSHCDGIADCYDGSDEKDCSELRTRN